MSELLFKTCFYSKSTVLNNGNSYVQCKNKQCFHGYIYCLNGINFVQLICYVCDIQHNIINSTSNYILNSVSVIRYAVSPTVTVWNCFSPNTMLSFVYYKNCVFYGCSFLSPLPTTQVAKTKIYMQRQHTVQEFAVVPLVFSVFALLLLRHLYL